MITPAHVRSAYRVGTLRSRSRARRKVVESAEKAGAWLLQLECGHATHRPVQFRVTDRTRFDPPKHVYCVECPLR